MLPDDVQRREHQTILVAEDEPFLQELVLDVLESAGFRVLLGKDGRQALDLFEAHAEEIDLLFLDDRLPDGPSGQEVYDAIRRQAPHLPALFCSGYGGGNFPAGFFDREDRALIAKPYRPGALLVAIRGLLDRPRASSETPG